MFRHRHLMFWSPDGAAAAEATAETTTTTEAAASGTATTEAAAATETARSEAAASETTGTTTETATASSTEATAAAAASTTTTAGPPETYTLEAPPEAGLEASDLEAFATEARAAGWTNEQAQSVLTLSAQRAIAQRAAMKAEFDAHPDLGGANAVKAEEGFLRALDRFLPASTPEGARLRTELTKSGNQHNVPFRLLMANIGRAMGEDPGLGTGAPRGTTTVRLPDPEVMYPTMAAKK
jgi:hypothetical protein